MLRLNIVYLYLNFVLYKTYINYNANSQFLLKQCICLCQYFTKNIDCGYTLESMIWESGDLVVVIIAYSSFE